MTKVLFVCLGNICRSPAAEAVFRNIVNRRGVSDQFSIDSAGTSAHHAGEKADSRIRAEAMKRGIEVTSISRQFEASDFSKFDYILVMDESNYRNILKLDKNQNYQSHVLKMTDFASGKYQNFDEVPDPYYGGLEGFQLILDLLENTCEGLFSYLIDKNRIKL